jgi:hypothetical protein
MFLTAKVVKKIIMSKNNRLFFAEESEKSRTFAAQNKRGI